MTFGEVAVVSACWTVSISEALVEFDVSVAVPVYESVRSIVRGCAPVSCVYASDPMPPIGKVALRAGFGLSL